MVVLISFLFILMVICLPVIGGIVSFGGAFLLNKRMAKICLVVSVFTLGILSILFVPFVRNDLYRYFQTMQSVQYLQNLHQFFEYAKTDSVLQYQNNPLFNILEFEIAKTHHFYFLPYIDTIVCYTCVLYPIFDLKEQGKISNVFSLWLAIGGVATFYFFYIMTYIRWVMACALFVLVSYLYFFKLKKARYLWLYLIPIFFHTGIILAVLIAIYIALLKRVKISSLIIPIPFFVLILVLSLVLNVSGGSNNIIFKLIGMLQSYTVIAKPSDFSDWVVFIANLIGTWILVVVALYFAMNGNEKLKNKFTSLTVLESLCYAFLLTSIQITERYSLIISMLAIITLVENFNNLNNKNRVLPMVLISFSILVKVYAAYLKFKGMQFSIPLSKAMFANIFFYIGELLKNAPTYFWWGN